MLGDEELSVNRDGQECLSKQGDGGVPGQRTGRKMAAVCMDAPLSRISFHCISIVKVTHLMSSDLQKENNNPRGREEFASLELD